jgi:cysteine-rich repeat protein
MLAPTCRFVVAVVALMAVVTASATTAAAQIPAFGPPAPLNSNAATDTAIDYFQNFATDGAGHWIAIWGHQEPGPGGPGHGYVDGDLQIVRSADDGISWTAPAPMFTDPALDGTFANIPSIASDGAGTWVAVWRVLTFVGTTRTDDDLLTARSTDDGVTWSVPVSLNTDAASDDWSDGWPQIATDRAGTWIAVWYRSNGQILSARSTDGGGTWSAPAALHATAVGILPRIATGAGSWVVVWEADSGDSDVMASHSSDGGVTWSAAVPLNADAAIDTDYDLMPHVAADASGTVVAVWTVMHYPPPDPENPVAERDVLVARSTDGGATWTAPAPLNTNAAIDSGDDDVAWVATDGSGAWIAAWTSYDTLGGTLAAGYGHILQARSTDGGASWSAPTALNTDAPFDDCSYRAYYDVRLAPGAAGTWLALWSGATRACPVDYGIDGDLFFARASTACGNGAVDPGESCDDGGVAAGDGCDPSCHVEPPPGVCGNGVHERGEECDDGNSNFDDGCDPTCHFDPPPSVCGDGVAAPDEACDDGNHVNGDGCDESCNDEPYPSATCGDGVVDAWEDCDDGNIYGGDGCDAGCHLEPCRPAPDATCHAGLGGKTSLKMRRDAANPYKNRFDLKYRGLDAVAKTEFGTPTVNNSYHVCVYQAGSLVSTTRIGAGGSCSGSKPCWRGTATGFTFKDKMLTQDGALQLDLRAGAAEKAVIRFSGRAASFEMPTLPATGAIVVQLRRSNDPFCWSAAFSAPFTKNDANTLTDKAD